MENKNFFNLGILNFTRTFLVKTKTIPFDIRVFWPDMLFI